MTEFARYTLTFSCKDQRGIVASVTQFIQENDGLIIEAQQFGDASTGQFFLRMEIEAGDTTPEYAALCEQFAKHVGEKFAMDWKIHRHDTAPNIMIMVSKTSHCLYDLLHRFNSKMLDANIVGVVSNHETLRGLVEWHNIPYHYMPITKDNKAEQEKALLKLIESENVDLLVLARYMQVLSHDVCAQLVGRAINIHHSFLPSFKGAKPYHQAYDRGVKIIGATAHYVTADLDEGPIIEQEVVRVTHSHSPEQLVAMGHDIERTVLARAVKNHIQHRVLLNGHKTVVFS